MKLRHYLLIALIFPLMGYAAEGIGLSATRVIFPGSDVQKSINIINQGSSKRFLINAWVTDASEKKTLDLIVTPPLFVSEPGTENSLRIYRSVSSLPQDRETLYWLNVKSIPAVDKNAIASSNTLQLAVLTREKILYRPPSLQGNPESYADQLTIEMNKDGVIVKNNGPYFLSMVNIRCNDKNLPPVMVPPLGQKTLQVSVGHGTTFSYQTVNDYGALTHVISRHL